LEGRVEFMPFLPPTELAAMFRAADIVCVPSVHPEPFGLVAAEAMACGACVVASDRGALPGVVADAGVVARPETDELAAALESVLMHPATRRRLGRAGVRRAAEFSWDRSYRRLLAVIGERNDT
jgi:D-inositol-3-phosphate glycosyltransferase